MSNNNQTTNGAAPMQAAIAPEIKSAIRGVYFRIRGVYTAAPALAYARAFVGLHLALGACPALAYRVPYIYGDAGKVREFAHRCASDYMVRNYHFNRKAA